MNKIASWMGLGLLIGLQLSGSVTGAKTPNTVNNAGLLRHGDRSQMLFPNEGLDAEESPEDPRDFEDLNSGMPLQIERNLGLKNDRNYIVLIKKSPQYVFDFRTADRMRRALMTMSTGDMDIGHAMVAWQCQGVRGKVDRGATGQTGESQGQGYKMIRSGWGLSTFMSTFSDGYLNTPDEVEEVIEEASQEGRLRFIALEVTKAECQKMLSWVRTYIQHPKEPQRKFGLNVRPDKFEGGGCGSFAVTMLEQAGVFSTMTPQIWRTLKVPTHLLGVGSSLPAYTEFYKKIPYDRSVWALTLTSDYWSCRPGWAPCHDLRVADPEMIIHLISSLEKSAGKLLGRRNVMFGEAGMRHSQKERTARFIADPMDRNYEIATQKIDRNFDRQTALMENAADVYMQRHLNQGGNLRPGRLVNVPGLIIEKGSR